ncbi:MAG: gliding motility-associated C-terminal domain-containing protein [Chitinophagaceae bacterium]|nr:gliding motility-associated C-terminal domain-containing protein [Chitinophagaceae bacterium]
MTLFARFAALLLALSVLPAIVYAQLCQGSLGDPLVNITFGSGSNPGPPLAAATSTYQYFSNDCPNDGFYTVRSNTSNCFGDSWHTLTADHTGNPSGYFMLVNASIGKSDFYLDTVKSLCSGTTYEFAAWVVNVLKSSACSGNGIQPKLIFTIERTDGTIIQTYNTGFIPQQASPLWQQWGFFFTTPVGVSDIVLRIFNDSPGGCGNDLALDDITFRPCGPQLTSSITGNSSANVNLCEGAAQSFTFNGALSAGFNNPSLQWQQSINGGVWTDIPGATATSYSTSFPANTASGIYSFRLSAAEAGNMSSAKCRVASPALTVTIHANPVTSVSSNSPVCENNELSFTATGGASYQWNGVNGFSATGSTVLISQAQPVHSGKYYVLATNTAGCTHLDSVTVSVNMNPVASVSFTEATICEGDLVQLKSNGGGTYQWQPASGLSSTSIADPFASPADTTGYKVIVTNQFSCTDTGWVTVNVVERARANAGPDKYIIKNNSVQISALATGQNISYTWSPDIFINDITSLQPVVAPPHDTTYILTVLSEEGCGVAVDSVHVYVYADVYVPTAFTPNNDGKNDTWFIPALTAYSVYTVSVYNRYGELIFHIKDANKPWDGKYKGIPQPAGAYVYVVELKDEKRLLKGTLMIVR